ncbi:MAG: hypothetical protein HOP11_04365 [Saprospiraceae bacterium]|nr:hypothetical protein [Saprospiraceae bacterium]
MNLENFYLSTGFELHFLACLVEFGFIIHEIDSKFSKTKSLAKEQQKRPIHKSELFNVTDFHYDDIQKINVLIGIKEKSLSFYRLCKSPAYQTAINKSDEIFMIANEYRKLRNQIHMPGDFLQTKLSSHIDDEGPLLRTIVDFVNIDIIEKSNYLRIKNDLKYNALNKIVL